MSTVKITVKSVSIKAVSEFIASSFAEISLVTRGSPVQGHGPSAVICMGHLEVCDGLRRVLRSCKTLHVNPPSRGGTRIKLCNDTKNIMTCGVQWENLMSLGTLSIWYGIYLL